MLVACAVPPIPAPDTQYPETIAHLTLREKIAQMIMVRVRGDYYHSEHWYRESLEKWLKEDGVGGVITFGGSIHGSYHNIRQFQQWAKYPILVAADYERGLGQWMGGGTLFPSNMAVAATGDSSLAYEQGKITALEARALGVQITFSPVMDINNNPDNPIINFRAILIILKLFQSLDLLLLKEHKIMDSLPVPSIFPDMEIQQQIAIPACLLSKPAAINWKNWSCNHSKLPLTPE